MNSNFTIFTKVKHRLSSILVIILLPLSLCAQMSNSKNYYSGFFLEGKGYCLTYDSRSDTELLEQFYRHGDYLHLPVLRTKSVLSQCIELYEEPVLAYSIPEEEYRYLEYVQGDRDSLEGYFALVETIPEDLLIDIHILRNKVTSISRFVDVEYALGSRGFRSKVWHMPYELLTLTILDPDDPRSEEYKHHLINVKVEFHKEDAIGFDLRRRIVCPYEITNKLTAEVNRSLINYGYLVDDKRWKYPPDLRAALIEFQTDYSLMKGFLDYETLNLLEINMMDYVEPETELSIR